MADGASSSVDADARDAFIGGVPRPPFSRLADWTLVAHDAEAMTMTVSFAAKADFLNPAGIIQGGILAAMMDDVMGPLVVVGTNAQKFPTTTDLHATYYAAAQPGGRLVVTARIERLGGTIAYTSAEIRDEAGGLLAKAIQTARLIPMPTPPNGDGDAA